MQTSTCGNERKNGQKSWLNKGNLQHLPATANMRLYIKSLAANKQHQISNMKK
jgi:hypothetical protein